MIKILFVLKTLKLLNPEGFTSFMKIARRSGINFMTLLEYISCLYPEATGIVDDTGSYTYKELFETAEHTAQYLKHTHQPGKQTKAALLCRNHAGIITNLFALSRLGVETCLLNTDMKKEQLEQIIRKFGINLLICDGEFMEWFNNIQGLIVEEAVLHKEYHAEAEKLQPVSFSKFSVLTGGTTGQPKSAAHKSVMANYIYPFYDLLSAVKIQDCNSVLIPVPVYHGMGLTTFFFAMVLGRPVYFMKKFTATRAAELIDTYKIEVISGVPLVMQRLVNEYPGKIGSLKRVISGGAALSPALCTQITSLLGDVVFNLYGSTEAGFSMMALPQDLKKYPGTIGKPLTGVRVKLSKKTEDETGEICIRGYAGAIRKEFWVHTGDLARKNEEGYYFLCGRKDDMIVSGGENVYPIELEHILQQHPDIQDAIAIGIADDDYGQRLAAFVSLKLNTSLTEETLRLWLKEHAARYFMPKHIRFMDAIPYTPVGKPDKKVLRGMMEGEAAIV